MDWNNDLQLILIPLYVNSCYGSVSPSGLLVSLGYIELILIQQYHSNCHKTTSVLSGRYRLSVVGWPDKTIMELLPGNLNLFRGHRRAFFKNVGRTCRTANYETPQVIHGK